MLCSSQGKKRKKRKKCRRKERRKSGRKERRKRGRKERIGEKKRRDDLYIAGRRSRKYKDFSKQNRNSSLLFQMPGTIGWIEGVRVIFHPPC